jgi:hypothetical protein
LAIKPFVGTCAYALIQKPTKSRAIERIIFCMEEKIVKIEMILKIDFLTTVQRYGHFEY